jgi:hypothetical protein
MNRDGSDSARARSARIRVSHDDEATQLESMRLRTLRAAETGSAPLPQRLVASLARLRWKKDLPASVLVGEAEIDMGAAASTVE